MGAKKRKNEDAVVSAEDGGVSTDRAGARGSGAGAKPPAPRRFADEVLSDDMAAILRAKTPAERLAMAFEMWRFAGELIERTARRRRPEWTDAEMRAHVVRRMSHGAC